MSKWQKIQRCNYFDYLFRIVVADVHLNSQHKDWNQIKSCEGKEDTYHVNWHLFGLSFCPHQQQAKVRVLFLHVLSLSPEACDSAFVPGTNNPPLSHSVAVNGTSATFPFARSVCLSRPFHLRTVNYYITYYY